MYCIASAPLSSGDRVSDAHSDDVRTEPFSTAPGDGDLLALNPSRNIAILTPAAFVQGVVR
jgi:hypothetical protein